MSTFWCLGSSAQNTWGHMTITLMWAESKHSIQLYNVHGGVWRYYAVNCVSCRPAEVKHQTEEWNLLHLWMNHLSSFMVWHFVEIRSYGFSDSLSRSPSSSLTVQHLFLVHYSLSLILSLSFILCSFLSVSLFHSIFISVSLFHPFLSFHFILFSIHFCLSLSFCLYFGLSPSSISLSLLYSPSISVSLSFILSPFLFLFCSPSISLSPFFSVYFHLSTSLHVHVSFARLSFSPHVTKLFPLQLHSGVCCHGDRAAIVRLGPGRCPPAHHHHTTDSESPEVLHHSITLVPSIHQQNPTVLHSTILKTN